MENSNFFMYTWSSGQTTSFIEINQPGIYSLKVMDQNKCVDFDTFLVSLFENPIYQKAITYNYNLNHFDIKIESDASNTINWMPYEDIKCNTCIDQIIKPKEDLFWLYFTVKNKFECVSYDSLLILNQDSVVGFVAFPNAFSPNSDFRNEKFGPIVKNVKKIQWQVFDKIGQMIFWSDSPNHWWNGTFKNEACMNNLYIWTCEVTFNNGKTEKLKGEVYLMR
jgi:gliding motility-associated-like protein